MGWMMNGRSLSTALIHPSLFLALLWGPCLAIPLAPTDSRISTTHARGCSGLGQLPSPQLLYESHTDFAERAAHVRTDDGRAERRRPLPVAFDHVFYLATNKHLKYETQGEVVSLA